MSNWLLCFWLPGQPPRKSNSRKIVTNPRTGSPMVIKSLQARRWAQAAIADIGPELRHLKLGSAERPLRILFECFYETRRPDLSVELVLDVLERAGVISNDRHIYEYTARKFFSRERPGVLVHIGYLQPKDGHKDVDVARNQRFEYAGKLGPWARHGMQGTRYLDRGKQASPDYRKITDVTEGSDGTWRYICVRLESSEDWLCVWCGTNTYERRQ